MLLLAVATASTFSVSGFDPDLEMDEIPDEEARAKIYLDYLDKEFSKWATKSALAEWQYASNITDENLEHKVRPEAAALHRQPRLQDSDHCSLPTHLSHVFLHEYSRLGPSFKLHRAPRSGHAVCPISRHIPSCQPCGRKLILCTELVLRYGSFGFHNIVVCRAVLSNDSGVSK
jgi:hypothetical protein